MKITQLCAVVAALGLLTACGNDDNANRSSSTSAPAPTATTNGASAGSSATTKTTPADIGQAGSLSEKKEGANPQQGQVDPKHAQQHRDFEQKGDAAGPKSAETAPKVGN